MRTVGIWLAWVGFLFVVWMSLVATTATAEVLAGLGVATLGATGAEIVRRTMLIRLRPWQLIPRGVWRLPGVIVRECLMMVVVVWRQLRTPEDNLGAFRGIAFDPGADDDPRDAARRAAYTALVSVSPNTYVVGIDREHNNMLVHELVPGPRETTRERVLGRL